MFKSITIHGNFTTCIILVHILQTTFLCSTIIATSSVNMNIITAVPVA